jgi:hypothetical protein
MRTSESASSSCLSSSPPWPWPAPSFLGTNGRISFLKLTRMTCTQHKINATSAGERHRGIINGESRACTRRRGTWRSGTVPRCRRPCPPARPNTAGTSPCWRPGARRRRRERQQLLPEHEVLPHPAPDDVAEPTARPSAYPSAQRPASKVPYLVRSRAMSREYGWAEWISCSG